MKKFYRIVRPLSIVLAAWVFLISGPFQAGAALVGTESIIDAAQVQNAREVVRCLMAREDIQSALVRQGIDPAEAQARAEGLSDAEAVRLANVMESLPAGGSAIGIVVFSLLLVFIILLITDILGYTDIFPFTKRTR
ncbi:MAG: PA2779 family protein [Desulfobacterales bacterium]